MSSYTLTYTLIIISPQKSPLRAGQQHQVAQLAAAAARAGRPPRPDGPESQALVARARHHGGTVRRQRQLQHAQRRVVREAVGGHRAGAPGVPDVELVVVPSGRQLSVRPGKAVEAVLEPAHLLAVRGDVPDEAGAALCDPRVPLADALVAGAR